VPEHMRLSPDGRDLAICNRPDPYFPWRVTDGSQRAHSQVADWQPVIPAISPPAMQAPEGVIDTYVPPGNVAIVSPGITAWPADDGGLFIRTDTAALPQEEDVLARIERWIYRTFGDDDERGVPALAEELLDVVDGAEDPAEARDV
jgi:hypothetical protein